MWGGNKLRKMNLSSMKAIYKATFSVAIAKSSKTGPPSPSLEEGSACSTPAEWELWARQALSMSVCACGDFFASSSPLRLNRKCLSLIPISPICLDVGEKAYWSPCDSHEFNANTEHEIQGLVKCGFFTGRLTRSSVMCHYVFWQILLI